MSDSSNAETRSLHQSRRELWLILMALLGCAIWVISYCSVNGYNLSPEEVSTVLAVSYTHLTLPTILLV